MKAHSGRKGWILRREPVLLCLPLDVYWFLPNICLLHVHLHHSWELAFSD